jgi:hypothetical protein
MNRIQIHAVDDPGHMITSGKLVNSATRMWLVIYEDARTQGKPLCDWQPIT